MVQATDRAKAKGNFAATQTGPALAWYRDGALMLIEEYEEDRSQRAIL